MIGGVAEEGDAAAALRQQVRGDVVPALEVVAADRHPRLPGQHRAPAHEVRALVDQVLQPLLRLQVVAIAEQDQPVGLLAVAVVGAPVVRQLLERHQQVVAMAGAGAGDRPQHRVEERVDQRVVGGRVFEEQQRQGTGIAQAQAGGVLVDLVVQLARDRQDLASGLLVDRRTAAQRARDRGLRHACQIGDVQRCGLAFDDGASGCVENVGEACHGGCWSSCCGAAKAREWRRDLSSSSCPQHRCVSNIGQYRYLPFW
ncbi:hypothetical protein NB706_002401 [Xanthomonas sacchari]|nr:hypothetical protein [Xanthomonas sacchari]